MFPFAQCQGHTAAGHSGLCRFPNLAPALTTPVPSPPAHLQDSETKFHSQAEFAGDHQGASCLHSALPKGWGGAEWASPTCHLSFIDRGGALSFEPRQAVRRSL